MIATLHRSIVLVLLPGLLTAGCAPVPGPAAPDAPPVTVAPPPEDARPPAGAFDPPVRPEPVPDPEPLAECPAEAATAIARTVSAQLDAFARADLDAAYALTSTAFRQQFDRGAFERLILGSFVFLLTSRGHRTADCFLLDGRAVLIAGVRTATGETVLRYELSEAEGGWRIDGAGELRGVTLPDVRVA